MAPDVQVEEEGRQRAPQRRARAPGDAEPRAGQLGGPGEVEDAHRLAEVHVILRLERESRWVAVAADLHGKVFAIAVRNLIQWQVRDAEQQIPQLSLSLVVFCIGVADPFLELTCPLLQRRDIFALTGRLLHFLRLGYCLNVAGDGHGDPASTPQMARQASAPRSASTLSTPRLSIPWADPQCSGTSLRRGSH